MALLVGALVGQLGFASMAGAQQQAAPASTTPAAPAASTPAPAAATPATPAAPATAATPAAGGAVSGTPTDPAKKPEPEQQGGGDMQQVMVVAERPSELIDRSVYDVKAEVVTPNASAADVIANVPNVTVDVDGKVAIRGQQNTQVFVDGKRSAMFAGENGGEALNSYPADALESIEVITTPGAEFGSEGGGGPILNLITRRVRPAGGRATISGSVGAQGRYSTGLNGSYNSGRVQLDGNMNFQRNVSESFNYSDTVTQTALGERVAYRENNSRTPSRTFSMNPTLRYNVGAKDRASAALNFQRGEYDGGSNEYYVTRLAGAPYEEYTRRSSRGREQTSYNLALSYEHKPTPQEEWKYDLRSSSNDYESNSFNRNTYLVTPPTGPRRESTNGSENSNRTIDLSMDYKRQFSPNLNVTAGAKLGRNSGQSDADYFNIDPLTGEEIVDDNRASAFKTQETSYAIYLSPQFRLFESWRFRPGIRYERVNRDVDYINQNNSSSDSSKKVLPSASVQYSWGDQANVVGSWSRRITRPSREDINPNIRYIDEYNYAEGDPRIAPTHTNSYELKYTDTWFGANTNLQVYRNVNSPLIGTFLTPVPDSTAVLRETVNYGDREQTGITLNVQARPTRTFNVGATIRISRDEQAYLRERTNETGQKFTLVDNQQVYSRNLQLRAQYAGIEGHQFQLNGNYTGKELRALEVQEPTWQVTAAWTWKITDKLRLSTSVRDIFDSNARRSRQVSDTLSQFNYREQAGRVFSIGLHYTLGGVSGDSRMRNQGGMLRGPGMQGGPGGPGGQGGGNWGGGGGGNNGGGGF